jgi:hypothetical protein
MPKNDDKNVFPAATVHLIESDSTQPSLTLRAGMRFEVHATNIVDTNLKGSRKVAARLCGGTSTCLALVDIERPKLASD